MPLTAAQKTRIRKTIARKAKVDVSSLASETGILTDLGMDPMEAGFMLADLSIKLHIDFRPILDEVDEAFQLTKRGSLTKASQEKIEQLLPGIPIPKSKLESSDDLWSVAMFETLFEQQLLRIEQGIDFEPISSKTQQAWKNQLPKELFHNRGCWVVDAILDGNCPGTERPEPPAHKMLLATLPKKVRLSIEETMQKPDAHLSIQEHLSKRWSFDRKDRSWEWTEEELEKEVNRWHQMRATWTRKQARTALALHNVTEGDWCEFGLARRFALEDPAGLALGEGLMLRCMWLQDLLTNALLGAAAFDVPIDILHPVFATRDVTLAERYVAAALPLKEVIALDPFGGAVLALYQRDFDTLQYLTRRWARVKGCRDEQWMVTCVKGIAKESAAIVAEALQQRVDTMRKARPSARKAVDLDVHGFYHLCQWAPPNSSPNSTSHRRFRGMLNSTPGSKTTRIPSRAST